MKYFIVILLIGFISCNDGGSDPEFVKTEPDSIWQVHRKIIDSSMIANGWIPVIESDTSHDAIVYGVGKYKRIK